MNFNSEACPLKSLMLLLVVIAPSPVSAQQEFDLQFDHTSLLVADLDRSAAFYENILHLKILETPWGDAAPVRFYSLGAARQLHLGVADRASEADRNVHLAFAIENFAEYLRFLNEQGVVYTDFPGSSRTPQVRPDGVRQVYLQDPDGNWIEINDARH